jgi:hypothetical protein
MPRAPMPIRADTRYDLTRWTNARRKEAGRGSLLRLISEERSARSGTRTASLLEGNPRYLASRLPGLPSRSSSLQPDHSHLPSTSYPATGAGTRSSVMAELRARSLIYQRVFDIPPIFLHAKLLFVSISVLVELYAYNPRHGEYGTASLQISKDQEISKHKNPSFIYLYIYSFFNLFTSRLLLAETTFSGDINQRFETVASRDPRTDLDKSHGVEWPINEQEMKRFINVDNGLGGAFS